MPHHSPNANLFSWCIVLSLSLRRYYVLLIEKCMLFEKYNVLCKRRVMASL